MPKKLARTLPARPPHSRFQTGVTGIRYVSTANDAQFDPFQAALPLPTHSLEAMETVARVAIPGSKRPAGAAKPQR